MVPAAEVESRVRAIAAQHFKKPPSAIALEARLREDLGADSLDLLELVFEFEQIFGVPIPDEAAAEIRTVADAIRYVRDRAEIP
ncbi:MAG TPA: acyl carrier protein [Methylomirabilota bacterium]|jgi:acyl carrier protein|nr:acyl carrier protein [Methylomirabilota bacterium]